MNAVHVSTVDLEVWYREFVSRLPRPIQSGVRDEDSQPNAAFQLDERFLQALWNEQRFSASLVTGSGRILRVISTGTWNVEAGPDFRDAVLEIGGEIVRGDIEVHRHAGDWHSHGHDRDPRYARVVLHAVWQRPQCNGTYRGPEWFDLQAHLDRPWQDLLAEIRHDLYPYARMVPPGQCAMRLAAAPDDAVRRLLHAAGVARFSDKTRRMLAEALRSGFEQALLEGLFEALGYKANRRPMRELVRTVPLKVLRRQPSRDHRLALLFGAGGLLPDPTSTDVLPELRTEAFHLWDLWWEAGAPQADVQWKRCGLRPFNSPERRIVAGVSLLEAWNFQPVTHLYAVVERADSPQELLQALRDVLRLPSSPWNAYANFRRRLRRPAALIGQSRVLDVLVNVVLPFLAGAARHRGCPELEERVRRAWLEAPCLQQNRAFIEAEHRLLSPPSRARVIIRRACEQQGLLQITRDFCFALGHDCSKCPLRGGAPVAEPPLTSTV